MQLVCVQNDLVEGRVAKGQRPAFLDPCRSRLRTGNIDLMLTGCRDRGCQSTKDVLLRQYIDQTAVPLEIFLNPVRIAVIMSLRY